MSDNLLQQIRAMGFLQKAELLRVCLHELYLEVHVTPKILFNPSFDVLKIPADERRKRLGERIKLQRQAQGIKQTELAAILGIAPQTLNVWESGKQEPAAFGLIGLSKALGVSTDWLLGINQSHRDFSVLKMSKEEYSRDLGARVKALRKQAGLTQAQVAEQLGIVPQSVTNYESGKIEPSIRNLISLAAVLGTSTDYLLGTTK